MTQPTDLATRVGRYVQTSTSGEVVRAFLPPPLPPIPQIDLLRLLPKLTKASEALGRLDGITMLLPRAELFLYMYVRKEAVLSSQIEGTQSTLSDLLRFESAALDGHPIDDIREVSNYVDAVLYGLERLQTLPLSLRLIREMHQRLLDGNRGDSKNPGEFRRSQNWIGGSRPGNALFVPPPVQEMTACLASLEDFMHETDSQLPPLLKAGLIHVQFETIHPFLDGNGRIGRLLITLFLCVHGVLHTPLLYLSLYLKTHRSEYYRLLQEVRDRGDWEAWLEFFLDGVISTANQAFFAANRIVGLFRRDRDRLAVEQARSALQVHDVLQQNPFMNAKLLAARTGLTIPTINTALTALERLGIVEEITGRKRDRVYSYKEYLDVLNEGTTL